MKGRAAALGLALGLVLTVTTVAHAQEPPAAPAGRAGHPVAARDRSRAAGAPSAPARTPATGAAPAPPAKAPAKKAPASRPPAPSAVTPPPRSSAPPPARALGAPSPCSLENNQDTGCEHLFRLGTLAVLAADAQSVPSLKLARRVCERYTLSFADAERALAARAGGYQETSPDAPFRRTTPARLPEALSAFLAFCNALSGSASPDEAAPLSIRASVVKTPLGRVAFADALKHARSAAAAERPAGSAAPPPP